MNKKLLLKVENLKMYYMTENAAVKAVDDISFDLHEGETLGIVGESGCGKSSTGYTLLNMPPAPGKILAGSIMIDNQDITKLSENEMRKEIRWKKISMVFQGAMTSLTPVYKIKKIMLETFLLHKKVKKRDALQTITEYLRYVGLGKEILERYPHQLSGGQKQRVVIAMALFLEPKVVICDEATTALDVVVQAQIVNLIKKLKKDLGVSFIFITHDLGVESEVADRICVMYAGKIVEIGKNYQIYSTDEEYRRHPYTEKLLKSTPLLYKDLEKLDFIEGTPPDLGKPLKGCRFYDRCPYKFGKCKIEEPKLRESEDGHSIACWRV